MMKIALLSKNIWLALVAAIIFAFGIFWSFSRPTELLIASETISIPGRNLGPKEGDQFASGDLKFPSEYIEGELSTKPRLPKVGESFILTYKFNAVGYSPVHVAPGSVMTGSSVAVTTSEWLKQRLIGSQVTLQLASDQLEPRIVDNTLTVAWSVRLESAGKHLGLLSVTSDLLPNGGGTREVRLEASAVKKPIDWWVRIGSFLGFLVAIANLIQFIWSLQDRQSGVSNN